MLVNGFLYCFCFLSESYETMNQSIEKPYPEFYWKELKPFIENR